MLGRDIQRRLDDREIEELAEFLVATPDAMLLPKAHGFITAVLSAPTMVMPSAWQQRVLGDPQFESMADVERVLDLTMRLYNGILSDLDEGREVAPPNMDDADVLGLWCAGYLEAARMDESWLADEFATLMLFPFGLLAGELDLVGEEDSDGNIIQDPTPQLQRARDLRGTNVLEMYRYWKARRVAPPATTIVRGAPKVGRNDPCPCGSGQKYKKCCALRAH